MRKNDSLTEPFSQEPLKAAGKKDNPLLCKSWALLAFKIKLNP